MKLNEWFTIINRNGTGYTENAPQISMVGTGSINTRRFYTR